MNLEKLKIRDSYSFAYDQLSASEKLIFDSLPKDYQDFLKQHNGGFVDDSQACFKNHLVWRVDDKINKDTSNCLEEFWGFISYENHEVLEKKPASILHEHFNRHLDELFLPNGVLVIGRCLQNCLVAMSLSADNFGEVYYWEWYWQYPWYKQFFEDRVAEVQAKYPDLRERLNEDHLPFIEDPPRTIFYKLDTPEQKRYMEASDALNYATLVKVADSFTEFLGGFYEDNGEED